MQRHRRPSLAFEGVIIPEGNIVKETLDAKTVDDGDGKRLNQYCLGRVLGRGSFGTVYRAYDDNLKKAVAIKEFSKTKLRKEKARKSGPFLGVRGRGRGRGAPVMLSRGNTPPENPIELVRGEIAILKKLQHENVVKLFEVLDDPDQDYLYMVFELCEKGCIIDISMDKVAKPLPTTEARNYFRQMILGIEYLHEQSICHRDIKPDNMMISEDGTLKIVDFGVSEMFNNNDKLEKEAGSPAFYPPELCMARRGDISCRAGDIWALGVTLYCLVCGKLPFVGSNVLQLYENIKNQEVSYPQDMDSDLANLISKMLDKNPDTRINLDDVRSHPWVTQNGKDCLISKEENCCDSIEEITEADLKSAIKPVASIFTLLKAVSKFKRSVSGASLARSSASLNSPLSASLNSQPSASLNSQPSAYLNSQVLSENSSNSEFRDKLN